MDEDELFTRLRRGGDDAVSIATRLRDRIEQLIDAGHLQDGDRLPPERRIAQVLDISRPTVRQVMESLEERGAVSRRQGAGTFVTDRKVEGNLHVLVGLSDDVEGAHRTSRTKVLQFGYCAPEPAAQRALEIDDDAMSAVRLVRVRRIDGVPSTYEISWMPAAVAGHLVGKDLSDRSLFRLLAETKGIQPDHGTERLRAASVGADEAVHLECAPGAACFLVDRTTFDRDGAPIEYATTILRGDRFFYSTTLQAPSRLSRAAEHIGRFETLAADA